MAVFLYNSTVFRDSRVLGDGKYPEHCGDGRWDLAVRTDKSKPDQASCVEIATLGYLSIQIAYGPVTALGKENKTTLHGGNEHIQVRLREQTSISCLLTPGHLPSQALHDRLRAREPFSCLKVSVCFYAPPFNHAKHLFRHIQHLGKTCKTSH